MKRYAADMLDGKNINGQFDFPVNEPGFTLSMTQRRDLYLIFKEAVNNLAKYSQAKHAVIRITTEAHKIELLVKDDGKGFDLSNTKTGNGLQNMQQRAKASGAEVTITSKPGEGTTVKLEMRIS
jgi:signal transduction histidine kinase